MALNFTQAVSKIFGYQQNKINLREFYLNLTSLVTNEREMWYTILGVWARKPDEKAVPVLEMFKGIITRMKLLL